MEVKRIFDLLPYIKKTFNHKPDTLAGKFDGQWRYYSIDDYIELSNSVSYGLLAQGAQKGDAIAIISGNRPEWNFLDMGIQQIGAIPIPIYPTISESDYNYILNLAQVKYVFVEGAELLSKIEHILPEIPTIKEIYTFKDRQKYTFFAKLVELGNANPQPDLVEQRKAEIGEDDLATILFTSGTTGNPKGVMLSHRNIVSNFKAVSSIPPCDETCRALSYLPLCHIFERMMGYLWQYMGVSLYYAENIGTVANDMKFVKPQCMTTVPRLLEKIYDKMYSSGLKQPWLKRSIFFWAFNLALRFKFGRRPFWIKLQETLADKLVFKTLREATGGRIRVLVSGGAALQPRLGKFFTGIGVPIIEGYGLTETSPVIAVSNFKAHGRKFGTVGPVLPGVEVKIAADGEVLCRGENVMMGYYRNDDETKIAIDDQGWFHTGDLGNIEPKGQLRITGRKKQLFKTSFGKYVNPNLLEDKFKESPFIEHLMVVGERQKFVAAILVLDWTMVKGWWDRKKMGEFPKNREDAIADKRLDKRLRLEIDKYNKSFGDTEKIKRFVIIPDEWSTENGAFTPTMKLRRRILEQRYEKEIEKLFS